MLHNNLLNNDFLNYLQLNESTNLERTRFLVFVLNYIKSLFEMNEENSGSEEKSDNVISMNQISSFLKVVGLVQPIDYIFLDYAMNQNRNAISKTETPLHFLFEVVLGSKQGESEFPYSTFLEKVRHKFFDNETDSFKEEFRYVLYNFCPSDTWQSRVPLSFSDFHIYYLDVLKPVVNQSAEELYSLFDMKRGETYFLMFGDRSVHDKLIVLFVRETKIIVFHIPPMLLDLSEICHICKWVSLEIPVISSQIHEHFVFELPPTNLVLTEEGVQIRKKQWEEAFNSPEVMDQETKSDLSMHTTQFQDESCDMCGA